MQVGKALTFKVEDAELRWGQQQPVCKRGKYVRELSVFVAPEAMLLTVGGSTRFKCKKGEITKELV